MFLKNTVAQLISINTPQKLIKDPETGKVISAEPGVRYDILPAGPSVDVPDETCETEYVHSLLESGELVVTGESTSEPESEDDDFSDMDDEAVISYAQALNIKVVKKDFDRDKVIAEIKKAQG